MMVVMEPATTLRFSTAARALACEARSRGLVVPGFRSPPRLVGANRSIRRRVGGPVVAVRVHGRPWPAVLADLVEGVVVANRLVGPRADELRAALWTAAGGEAEVDRVA
jgi:hypothetical protein